jgi:hypothetical protein
MIDPEEELEPEDEEDWDDEDEGDDDGDESLPVNATIEDPTNG